MASINDVAKQAGVSISTVSRVMNGHPNVTKEKKEAVFKAIADLNYVPNALAQGLVKKTTNSIAVLIADITNMFYANLLKSLEERLNDKGYYTIIGNTEWNREKEREYIQFMLQKQVDGIVLTSTTLEKEDLKKISLRGIPLVVLDREVNVDKIDRIRIDDFKGGYQATEHLLKTGYQKLIHFSGPTGISSAEDRKKGFLQCVEEFDLAADKYDVIPGCFTEECGIKSMGNYLKQHNIKEPIGIFAGNDAIALGILKVLKERKISCPDMVGVVGFDDITFAKYSNPPLTTVKRPIREIGKIVIDTILDRLENKHQEHFYKNITLDVRLVIRESTRLKKPGG